MKEVKLNKGDKAFVAVFKNGGYVAVGCTVTGKRVSKYGRETYFITRDDGVKCDCTFGNFGHQNFSTWQDSLFCRHAKVLIANAKECAAFIKRANAEIKRNGGV